MPKVILNIDVPDVAAAEAFYTQALGLTVGRRFDSDWVELLGLEAPLHLLGKAAGTAATPGTDAKRRYDRHWSPVHLDIDVEDLEDACTRALAAGAVLEVPARDDAYGRIAMFADPFGHGFCLIQFNADGYDAVAS